MDTLTRLQTLEARNALLDVQHAYAQAFDFHEPERFREAFHHDATLDLGAMWGTYRGIEAILASAEASWAGAHAMHHWMANSLFDIDVVAGTASGSVALECVSIFVELGPAHVGGRYEDRFTCVDGRWKLSHRALEVQFVAPMPDWVPEQGADVLAVGVVSGKTEPGAHPGQPRT